MIVTLLLVYVTSPMIARFRKIWDSRLEPQFGVMDGRHCTLLIMQIYNRKTIPIAVPKGHYELVIEKAKLLNALT